MSTGAQNGTVIEMRNVAYRFPGGSALLNDLNLQVRRGETLMLLGRSGSGKTTTLKLINDLLSPTEGDVMVEGRATRDWDRIRLRRGIGYVHPGSRPVSALHGRAQHWPGAYHRKLAARAHPEARNRATATGRIGCRARIALSERTFRRSASTCWRGACAGRRSSHPSYGRAVRRARRHHARRVAEANF